MAMIGLTLLMPAQQAAATGWQENIKAGSDIVMKDHRWPSWEAGTYYCFWYMNFTPGHPRLGNFYGGINTNGVNSAPGMFMSYWGEVSNITEGEMFYSHGYGAEGASGGAHGLALFVRPSEWYRMVMRIIPPAAKDADEAFVGWWVKDVAKNEWHTHSVVRLPARASGFQSNSGFVEALGAATEHRAFERRLGYGRLNGQWYKADTVTSGGGKFFKLIEDGTVLRYDRAEPDGAGPGGSFTTKQADAPALDPPAIAEASALGSGNQVSVQWSVPRSASPQLSYKLEAFETPEATGAPLAVQADTAPHLFARRLDLPGAARSVRLTVTDIFDQQKSVILPVKMIPVSPAAPPAKTRPGLEYAYFDAPEGTNWEKLPDLDSLKPVSQGHVHTLDDTVRQERERLYALRYRGYLAVPADGIYMISAGTCDGSRMLIDGKPVIDNDGIHGRVPQQCVLPLQKGPHAFQLDYFKSSGHRHHGGLPDRISIRWEGPGFGLRRLAHGDFQCDAQRDTPALDLSLEGATAAADGMVEDNLVTIRASAAMRDHRATRIQLYAGDMLLQTLSGEALADPSKVMFRKLFPAGSNKIRARLWYDECWSVDAGGGGEFTTRQYNDGPWKFTALGHKFPLGARYKDGTASFSGEGTCVAWQQVKGDYTLTARIADITLTTPESGVYDQNWLGVYTSDVKGGPQDVGKEPSFNEYGFGVYLTAGRGMKGWADNEDFAGARMCFPTFPPDHRWLRIVRRGQRFEAFTSADGKAWRKAMEVISRHYTAEQYAGIVFRAVPGKGRGLFQGAMDHMSLEPGTAPASPRLRIRPADMGDRNRITAVVQAVANPAMLFARGPAKGLLKSADHGETWHAANHGLASPVAMAVRSVAVHPADSAIILRGGGSVVDGKLRSGLWRSADGGKTWQLVADEIDFDGRGPTSVFGEVIAFCPQDPALVVAAGESSGLFLSRDAGLTWERAGLTGERVTCVSFATAVQPNEPLLLVGTCADSELASLGLGKPAVEVAAPGRLYWGGIRDRKVVLEPRCELADFGVTNIGRGEWVNFATIATTRGAYYTWTHGNSWSQRIIDVPADVLITALGARQFKKPDSGPQEHWRSVCTTYAAPFSGEGSAAVVHAAHERTQNIWEPLAARPMVEGPAAVNLHEGASCILIDKDDSRTFFLCNRHGIFKTTDLGKSYRLVHPK